MRLIVLRAGDAVPVVAETRGEFAALIRETVGDAWRGDWTTVDLRTGDPLPGARDAAGVVITGSSSSVTERAPWMLRAEAFIRDLVRAETPVFGICFGHQLVAQALGGEVAKNPRGREIGTVSVTRLADDPIFDGIARSPFRVNATHVDTVAKLPDGARGLASTDLEPTAAFAYGAHVRCVQFHPELDGDAMRGYVTTRAPRIREEGLDADAILRGVEDAPDNQRILRNFVLHFVRRGPL